jgi:Gram-negative bacterial TonB protein C-terminal
MIEARMQHYTRAAILGCVIAIGGVVGLSAADNTLAAAKDLYAAAAYEDALAMLTKLTEGDAAPVDVAVQVAQYQSFCLFALGRTTEAETVARDLIRKHPLRPLQDDEMSPRVETMYTQVRRQVLPPLIREKYRAGKSALDRKDFTAAEAELDSVKKMITQAQKVGVKDESLNDLGLLAEGFLDLAHAAVAKADASAPIAAAPAPAAAAAPAAPEFGASHVYDAGDENITAPVSIRQQAPLVPAAVARVSAGKRGVLEVTIEADGSVSNALMRESIHTQYDVLVIRAARAWRYKPAMRNGAPVRFLKAVALQVTE